MKMHLNIAAKNCMVANAGKILFDPSIELARNGFEISESERFWLGFREQEKSQLPDIFVAFTDSSGLPYKSQQYVRRADLAHTLSRVAHSGSQDFYMGELAKEFACHFKEVGAPLDLDDLAITKARVEPALKFVTAKGLFMLTRHPRKV
jgi:gamma-glutamyltranspeptidase/glutathione hydrolase